MKKQIFITLLTLLSFTSTAQSFEGFITYKVEALNPNPEMIPDSTWQKRNKKTVWRKRFYDSKVFL